MCLSNYIEALAQLHTKILMIIENIPKYFYDLCPAHQADFVRVHVICDYGGIWLDSDTLIKSEARKMRRAKFGSKEAYFAIQVGAMMWRRLWWYIMVSDRNSRFWHTTILQ